MLCLRFVKQFTHITVFNLYNNLWVKSNIFHILHMRDLLNNMLIMIKLIFCSWIQVDFITTSSTFPMALWYGWLELTLNMSVMAKATLT